MDINQFMSGAKEIFKTKESSKTKVVQSLMQKLEANKERVEKTLNECLNKQEMKDKKEELLIVNFHIEKCNQLLEA